jgi:hypothetical protein
MRIQILIITLTLMIISSCDNKIKKVESSKPTLYEIKVANRFGLIDSSGNIVVNPQFDNIYIPYHDKNYDLIAVRLGTKIGFIDRNGKFKINPQFDIDTASWDIFDGTEFTEGLAIVKQNNLYGFIDTTGKLVIKFQFENCNSFREGLASFQKGKKWGFIDKTGKVIIEPQFDQASFFENGITEIRKYTGTETSDYPSLKGYINKKGKVIWQPSN